VLAQQRHPLAPAFGDAEIQPHLINRPGRGQQPRARFSARAARRFSGGRERGERGAVEVALCLVHGAGAHGAGAGGGGGLEEDQAFGLVEGLRQ
jgi:hypothetical protein